MTSKKKEKEVKHEPETIVDDFCKELYDFLEESKVETKCIFIYL